MVFNNSSSRKLLIQQLLCSKAWIWQAHTSHPFLEQHEVFLVLVGCHEAHTEVGARSLQQAPLVQDVVHLLHLGDGRLVYVLHPHALVSTLGFGKASTMMVRSRQLVMGALCMCCTRTRVFHHCGPEEYSENDV